MLDRTYYRNDYIFWRPAVSPEYVDSDLPTYRCYYTEARGLGRVLRTIVEDFGLRLPFEDLSRDLRCVVRTLHADFDSPVLSSLFYRNTSAYLFVIPPGVPGLVMMVFTLPSFPYVFKVMRDVFRPPKQTTHAEVRAKYQLVKHHDRVGRMADTLEYSNVAFPLARLGEECLAELEASCGSLVERDRDHVVIGHL